MHRREYERLYLAEERVWWFRSLHLFLERILLRYLNKKSLILDVGCGTGGLVKDLTEQGHRVVGLDYSPVALDFAKRRSNAGLVLATANQIPMAANFDFLVCVDLLEINGIDPANLVSGCLRVLKPGGYAVFVAAAHQWLLSEHDRAVNSTRRFTVGQLKELLERSNAKILRSTYLFFLLFPLLALRKLLNPVRQSQAAEEASSDVEASPQILNGLLFAVCALEAKLLPSFNFPLGTSALILVQKDA